MPDLSELLALMPFARRLGMALDAAAPGEVRGRLAWSPELCTAGGVLHGGAVIAFADSLGGLCAYLNLPADTTTATVSSSTAFLRPVRTGELTGVARPLHVGRTALIVQSEIVDAEGRPVAQTTQTQTVRAA